MPIAATDLIAFGAASRPSDDTATVGGAIDTTDRPDFTQWTANAVAAVLSDGADTRQITIQGRTAAGAIDTEVLTLNGVTEVVGAKTWERVLTITAASASGTRTVTVRQGTGGATRATISINETSRTAMFRQSASESGIAIRYEKFFWRNNHGSLTLNSADVTLTADPDSRIRIGLAATKGDSATATNRKTAPGGISFSDDSVVLSVPTGALASTEAIGTWVEQNLPASDTAHKTTFTTRLRGTSV